MTAQTPDGGHRWAVGAIHDSVAAVMREPGYRRSLRESIVQRVWDWLSRGVESLIRAAGGTQNAKRLAIAGALLLVIVAVARIAYAARLRDTARHRRYRRNATGVMALSTPNDADRLAAEGKYVEAVHLLYRVLIDSLERRERLHPHLSKTSGDYARELRARGSPVYAAFRAFSRRYDHVIFGRAGCDAAAYQELAREIRALVQPERAA